MAAVCATLAQSSDQRAPTAQRGEKERVCPKKKQCATQVTSLRQVTCLKYVKKCSVWYPSEFETLKAEIREAQSATNATLQAWRASDAYAARQSALKDLEAARAKFTEAQDSGASSPQSQQYTRAVKRSSALTAQFNCRYGNEGWGGPNGRKAACARWQQLRPCQYAKFAAAHATDPEYKQQLEAKVRACQ